MFEGARMSGRLHRSWLLSSSRHRRRSATRKRSASPLWRRLRLEVLEDRWLLAVLTVNSLSDNTTAGNGLVTLREAILAADADGTTDLGQTGSGTDTIEFAASLTSGGPATINLTSLGHLTITSSLAINGPGAN